MKPPADIEEEATRENLPEVPSLFGGLFGVDVTSKQYLADLRVAAAILAAFEGAAVNDWTN